jgi:hypothetical protein
MASPPASGELVPEPAGSVPQAARAGAPTAAAVMIPVLRRSRRRLTGRRIGCTGLSSLDPLLTGLASADKLYASPSGRSSTDGEDALHRERIVTESVSGDQFDDGILVESARNGA